MVRAVIMNQENTLTYRLNFFITEIRSVIVMVTLFLFWSSLYQNNSLLFGYSKAAIITYLIGVSFLQNIISYSNVGQSAGMIRDGSLSRFLLKPMSFFSFMFSLDIADKGMSALIAIVELIVIVHFFHFSFYIPHHAITYLFFFTIMILAVFLSFFMIFVVSLTAFWTEDPWSTRWIFTIVFMGFFSGSYFPLNILPDWASRILSFTPFPYLFYYPVQIWLEKTTFSQSIFIIGVCTAWTVVLYVLAKVWFHFGTRNFGAYGG